MLDSSKINQINNKIYDMGNYDYLVKERNTTLNESDTELYNLRTGEKVKSLSELKKQYNGLLQTKKNNFKNELNQKNYRATATGTVKQYVTNANYDILVDMYDFIGLNIGSWAVWDHCGPTAGTNIIKYWAKKRGVSQLYYSDDTWVFKSLCVNMKTNITGGTTVKNIYDGLWNYGKNTRGVTPRSGEQLIAPDYSKAKSLINKNFPFIMSLSNYPNLGDNHAVTCFGYYENNGTNYLIINNSYNKTWTFQSYNSLDILAYSYAEWTGK
ncbi:MAG: C39 family peptidase [Clostridium argentinense]|uniref:C39 family peptidase n=1 Tax=Clostridium faecium TaxID=2762223 RepID=A0ABR8YPZ4_9CLOT|nr:C39 family peptidase [Clostridium faecium]MBD8046294.1 C39 family peptidase [Clostridium faecium]MBS5824644.1 C39 family peptidase [Clostridium argentinense]MDU1349478.1 C39 family peptidase [Clostridium argentinense]